jgi:gliding motility-associated lipoprotein GldD
MKYQTQNPKSEILNFHYLFGGIYKSLYLKHFSLIIKNTHSVKYILLLLIFVLHACGKSYTPKPYGYFRVDLPENSYHNFNSDLTPYSFDISNLAEVNTNKDAEKKFWIDIVYPGLNATIYCSYFIVNHNLQELSEDSRKFVYDHSIKADGISERVYSNAEEKVYGILYELKGNTASSAQFVLTDSVKHFLRGALYFENVPNKDSIAPMADFVKKDIERLMESFRWKK